MVEGVPKGYETGQSVKLDLPDADCELYSFRVPRGFKIENMRVRYMTTL